MARLIARINTDRNGRRSWSNPRGRSPTPGEQVHRLGDDWVVAQVATWDLMVHVSMRDDGQFEVIARDISTGKHEVLTRGDLTTVFGRTPPKRTARGEVIEPKPPRPPRVKKPRLTAKEKRQQALIDTLFEAKLDEEVAS